MSRKVVDVSRLLAVVRVTGARRRGDEWWAPCPLPNHGEKTPSWSIADAPSDPTRHGRWHCFGCGRGGGPVRLVVLVLDAEPDAARRIVEAVGGSPDDLPPVLEIAAKIPGRLDWPVDGAILKWDGWPEGAKRHWEKRRGLPVGLSKFAVSTIVSSEAPRSIVFPVYSFGSLRTWVARSWVPTGRPHKSASRADGAQPDLALWGEPLIRPERGPVLACEGIFDALSLVALGYPNAVAFLGVQNLGPAKVAAMARSGSVVVCTDADDAGDEAADAIASMLSRHARVERARPPDGKDFGDAPVDAVVKAVDGAIDRVRRAA